MNHTMFAILTAAAIALPSSVVPVHAGSKALPPAFGKELVPDQGSQEYKGPSAEIEELKEESEEKQVQRARPHHGGVKPGRRIRIQLDGDEDGGGDIDGDF